MASDSKPLRVMLWATPRSLSTVIEKCMSFVPNTQIINEPFACADANGPEKEEIDAAFAEQYATWMKELEKIKVDLPMAFESEDCTYAFVKDTLEADYSGKRLIFCKDLAYALNAKYDMIPRSFRHTFVIRHPYRSLLSYKNMLAPLMSARGDDDFRLTDMHKSVMPTGCGIQQQHDLMVYLQENGEPDPIIIDADDLLANPASVLRQYCALVGIPFTEELLEWPSGRDGIKSWIASRDMLLANFHEWGGYYEAALNSTGFNPPKDMPRREDLTEDILEVANDVMPYYQKMHDLRIKP